MTKDEALELIEKERTDRIMKVKEGLGEILRKHNCSLIPYVIIEGNRVASDIKIVANDRKE